MKRVWEWSQIEVTHAIIRKEEFNQVLDEWAEIVYRRLCQLCETEAQVSLTSNGRTGTDG